MNRKVALFAGLLLVLLAVNGLIVQKERLIASGSKIYLELAPVDPRSLIQGDFMRLDYALSRTLQDIKEHPKDGKLVVKLDERGVAGFVRIHDDATDLQPGEQLLRFRERSGEVRVGSGAFFFQEGHAKRYEQAKYGEVRVNDAGTSVLIGLRDENLLRITAEQRD